jgi:hypothetical protein
MDPDYIAFRELVRRVQRDPAPAAERTRARRAGRELLEVLALRSMCWVIQAALYAPASRGGGQQARGTGRATGRAAGIQRAPRGAVCGRVFRWTSAAVKGQGTA